VLEHSAEIEVSRTFALDGSMSEAVVGELKHECEYQTTRMIISLIFLSLIFLIPMSSSQLQFRIQPTSGSCGLAPASHRQMRGFGRWTLHPGAGFGSGIASCENMLENTPCWSRI
jgi:hypothetical protein